MDTERTVRLFKNGRNQALRIPRDLELPGDEAILRKEGRRLVVEPVARPSLLSVLAVFVILYYYRQLRADSPLIATTLGLQLGGAFGNLVDRLGQGYVVDFIDVGVGPYRYWTFNIADSSIVIGIFGVLGLLWLEERRKK